MLVKVSGRYIMMHFHYSASLINLRNRSIKIKEQVGWMGGWWGGMIADAD